MKALQFNITPARYFVAKALGAFSVRAYYGAFSPLRLREVPVPELPGDDWVKVRTRMGGICASDVGAIQMRHSYDSYYSAFVSMPFVLGHENVGVICETGSSVRDFRVGDRVVVDAFLGCKQRGIDPPCEECRKGNFGLCLNWAEGKLPPGSTIGANSLTGGSWGEYFVAHESQLFRVADSIDDEKAVLIDPIACSLNTVLRRRPADGETVVVIGAGVIGLGVIACIRALGSRARVIALAKYPFQREQALRLGADLVLRPAKEDLIYKMGDLLGRKVYLSRYGFNPYFTGGVDAVYDCVGSGFSINTAMKLLRERGDYLMVGIGFPRNVNWIPIWFRELRIQGVAGRGMGALDGGPPEPLFKLAHDLILQGRLDLRGLVTHRFPLDRYRQAFDGIFNKNETGQIKTVFYFPD